MSAHPDLTDAECDAFRALPLDFNGMVRAIYAAGAARSADASGARWLPIDSAPQDGYMLVHEDGALRALLRVGGVWHKPGYPALVTTGPWEDVLVGQDAERLLKPMGYRLEHRDGCCENPTEWQPMPEPPPAAPGGPAGARRPDDHSEVAR